MDIKLLKAALAALILVRLDNQETRNTIACLRFEIKQMELRKQI